MPTWLVTGGAGFIGANFVRYARSVLDVRVINLDLLTYAGHGENLAGLEQDEAHMFVRGDIADGALVTSLFKKYEPDAVIHFAAESSVDRSIVGPRAFADTNVRGTHELLACTLAYWQGLRPAAQRAFRFLQVSTDEVYGSLDPYDPPFTEQHPFRPRSPYAASKAAADHFVAAYHETYGLPTLTTHCTNNYGPYQHPDKLIPVMILAARARKPLPIYGDGKHVRDWLFVDDHCEALRLALEKGRPGERYNIGASCERTNLQVIGEICRLLDNLYPSPIPHIRLATHIIDRPGHDRRYATNAEKARRDLGWTPRTDFAAGLDQTVRWYIDNPAWVAAVCAGGHAEWVESNYAQRGTLVRGRP